ncbi:hypothetical protein G3H63_17380, partial [Microbacterium resistens]|uniref:hypothetical protein n=1 Tax=Microbacterium resistens TaxID=156977 RepID=UPI001C5694A3
PAPATPAPADDAELDLAVECVPADEDHDVLRIAVRTAETGLRLTVDGREVETTRDGDAHRVAVVVSREQRRHSEWQPPFGHLVVAVAGGHAGAFRVAGGA